MDETNLRYPLTCERITQVYRLLLALRRALAHDHLALAGALAMQAIDALTAIVLDCSHDADEEAT